MDFWFSLAEISAWKSLSGSTLYFTERKARYSPGDALFRIVFYSLSSVSLIGEAISTMSMGVLLICRFSSLSPSGKGS